MAKRVGVLLSGCGRLDGSDVAEVMLTLLVIERAGAQAICAAPDANQAGVVDHLTGEGTEGVRNARAEAARIGPPVVPLSSMNANTIDALIVPGGQGPIATLSDYPEKRELCQIHPDLAGLLRAMLQSHRPMGFLGLSALLAARVLGPAAGVRVTVGAKGTPYAKHAAVMGADVRPCAPEDVIVDQKARVYTTPGFLTEGAHLPGVARAVDKLVRAVVANAKDRAPAPSPLPVETAGLSSGPATRPGTRPATGPGRGSA
jgi:enhancing lycopene biosynthesis protein 2